MKAERRDDVDALLHRYNYTYDAGDNMVTKEIYDGTDTDTYVYAHTAANELTKQSLAGTDTTFGYDAWGRMTLKDDGTYSAEFQYAYSHKLTHITSTFPGEGNATFVYGADMRRRERTIGATTERFRWASLQMVNKEAANGSLLRTYVGHGFAHVDGTTPATGEYLFYMKDALGSIRAIYDGAISKTGEFEFTPYGKGYTSSGIQADNGYASYVRDPDTSLNYTISRYYSPETGRWLQRDPAGHIDGPNRYAYVKANPVNAYDSLGLKLQACIRPLGATSEDPSGYVGFGVVHCYLATNDGSSSWGFFGGGEGVEDEAYQGNSKCKDTECPDDCDYDEFQNDLDQTKQDSRNDDGDWAPDEYDFVFNNCCHYVNEMLKAHGCKGITDMFPNYTLPPRWR